MYITDTDYASVGDYEMVPGMDTVGGLRGCPQRHGACRAYTQSLGQLVKDVANAVRGKRTRRPVAAAQPVVMAVRTKNGVKAATMLPGGTVVPGIVQAAGSPPMSPSTLPPDVTYPPKGIYGTRLPSTGMATGRPIGSSATQQIATQPIASDRSVQSMPEQRDWDRMLRPNPYGRIKPHGSSPALMVGSF